MWQYALGLLGVKILYTRVKKVVLNYKGLRDLKHYGQEIGCPFVPGEDVQAFRERLIAIRNKSIGQK